MEGQEPTAKFLAGNVVTVSFGFTGPADGSEFVSNWITTYPLKAGTYYHLNYGFTAPSGTKVYAGEGVSWLNTAPTSVLTPAMSPITKESVVPWMSG